VKTWCLINDDYGEKEKSKQEKSEEVTLIKEVVGAEE